MQDNNDLTIPKIEQISNSVQLLYQKAKNGEIEVSKIFLLKILEDYLTFLLTTHSESINLEIVANFLMSVSELLLWKTNLLLPFSQTQIVEEIESVADNFKENYWKEYKKYQSLVPILLKKEYKQREIYLTCLSSIDDFEEIPQNYDFSELILALESVLAKDNSANV
ncbi:MAG TPA: segregation/condensation protein A, partial [Atribacterota bacterium]|nr:segregation/condensation protein A [Atribacterota bacterium]